MSNCFKKLNFIFFIFLFFGVFVLTKVSSAATITAANCSQTEVQNILTSAVRGDTVIIPAGDCTWNSTVSFNKALTIKGAGKDKTFIRSNISVPIGTLAYGHGTYQLLYFNSSFPSADTNNTIRITDIAFDTNYKSSGIEIRNTSMSTALNKFVIDNCDFLDGWDLQYPSGDSTWTGVYMISVYGPIYGVIHSNRFYGFPKIGSYGLDVNSYNNALWNYDHGNEKTLFWEDNEFYGDGKTMHKTASWWFDFSGAGSTAVVRYNLFASLQNFKNSGGVWSPHHSRETGIYAGKGGEFYGNYITHIATDPDPSKLTLRMFTCRGGKSLIFYNKQYSGGEAKYSGFNYYPNYQPPPDTDTICSSDTIHSGDDVCAKDGQPQHTWRTYQWNNRVGISGVGTLIYGYPDAGLVENRDYANNNSNCSATGMCNGGIGCGNAVPTGNCTTGSAYWKTGQSCAEVPAGSYGKNPTAPISGTLYRCASTNNWQVYYTPYTYPHPLRNVSMGNTAPAAPTGLAVI